LGTIAPEALLIATTGGPELYHEVRVDVPVDRAGTYYFVIFGKDTGADSKDHQPRPLLERNAGPPVFPVNFYEGDGTACHPLGEVRNTIKDCFVLWGNKKCKLAKGYQIKNGKYEVLPNMPSNEHASVVLSGLQYGGYKLSPIIFALHAHGLDTKTGSLTGKAISIHWRGDHKCIITTDRFVDGVLHNDTAKLQDIPAGALSNCKLAILSGCSSYHGSDSLGDYLKSRGVTNVIGFDDRDNDLSETVELAAHVFVRDFFKRLVRGRELRVDNTSIRDAAFYAQRYTLDKLSKSDITGPRIRSAFLILNGERLRYD